MASFYSELFFHSFLYLKNTKFGTLKKNNTVTVLRNLGTIFLLLLLSTFYQQINILDVGDTGFLGT